MEKKLTAIQLKNAGDGKLFDGGGLTLVKKSGKGKWVYRYSHLGRRREMGLGAWPSISLQKAREARDGWAAVLASGEDPLVVREQKREDQKRERDRSDPPLEDVVHLVFESIRANLRGGGARGRWMSPLEIHVFPKIGGRPISKIQPVEIKDTLQPIWKTKHPTAGKAIQRLGKVFKSARLMGFDCDPFTVDAARHMLGEHRHVVQHIPSTAWQDAPNLYRKLDGGLSSERCLRWMMLTLVRSDGCRGARVSEVEGDIWTVPAERIKGQEGQVSDFRVPLPRPCLDMVEEFRRLGVDLLFPGKTGRSPITSTAIEKHMNELDEVGRPHGFRTTFRTWVQDTDACAWEVSETILGHKIGSTVERSYARSDLLERRRHVMDAWAAYLTQEQGNVVSLPSERS